jgi:hypothetical protein
VPGAISVTDSQAESRIQINEFLKDPLMVREVVLSMTNQGFIADSVLRNAGTTPSGLIRYRESSPLYADSEPATRAEFAEVPIAEISLGRPMVALVEERALGVVISDEMVRRMNIDMLQRQLMMVRNTMLRSYDRTFFNVLFTHPRIQRHAVTTPWGDPDAKQRVDIFDAIRLVEEASADGTVDSEFGFTADTMIIGRGSRADLFASDEFNRIYMNSPAITEAPIYRGQLPRTIYGLNVLVSPRVPPGKAIVMQRNIAGFIADELPLTVSETYRVEEKKFARADVQRASAVGLDQPKAVVLLEGV